jgi:hypothetical protein
MDRRQFVKNGCSAGLVAATSYPAIVRSDESKLQSHTQRQFPVHAIVPVVSDGE